MRENNYLFFKYDWYSIQENHKKNLTLEIPGYNGNQLLNTSTDDLCNYFVKKYSFDIPVLRKNDIETEQKETQVDISQDQMRYVTDRSRPYYIPGTEINIYVPFEGDPFLFEVKPSSRTLSPPRAIIDAKNNQLILKFCGIDLNSAGISSQFERRIKEIEDYLLWMQEDIGNFNSQLPSIVCGEIERRKAKLLNDQNIVAELGFPIKQRSDSNTTYAAPQVRRKIQHVPPNASVATYKPEPALSKDNYDHVLEVLENMTLVMERSPNAFSSPKLKEEDLRAHFLVQLNGHFEGNATGETFNYSGKTDILIRVDGKNIFIGECKFWSGAKKFSETIDQLLGYSSWRDTKTAILIFNRKKDFSKVLETIPPTVEAHPNFKRTFDKRSETSFQYIFGHKDDHNRELLITVLAFDVPILKCQAD